ncbi:MAG: hypothetical protein IPJ40_11670 [Saprospirales bacterium]|nr:hypothetical protein [Saprospirales bacterium]
MPRTFNANTGVVVGDGVILKTDNGGNTWSVMNFPGYYLKDLHFTGAAVGLAVGGEAILKTTDGGNSWAPLANISDDLNTVYMLDNNTIYAGGSAIYKSINGGEYFLPQPSVSGGLTLNKIAFLDGSTGFAVGDNGVVKRTTNNGDPFPLNDASIGEIESFPFNPCPDDLPVRVRVKNIGLNDLTQATIHWEVNGAPQADYLWNGNLPAGESSGLLTLGSFYFPLGNNLVKVWTSNPNAGPDDFTANDTLTTSLTIDKFIGAYTIGGINPDFPTIPSAIEAMTLKGICGPVVFNIRNGTYVGENVIPELQDVTADHDVTFQSESGDNASVILTSNWPNTTLILNGAKHFTFQNITIKSDGTTFNRAVELKKGASDIKFIHNVLEGKQTAFTTIDYVVVYSDGQPASTNITFSGNEIRYGSTGIFLKGSASSKGTGNVIEDNTFIDQRIQGLYCVFQTAPQVIGNRVSSTSTDGSMVGILMETCTDTFYVTKNRIDLTTGTGLYFNYCNILESGEGWVVNNFIRSGSSGLVGKGIGVEQSHFLQIYFNSVEIRYGGSAVSFYLIDTASYTHINIQNNLFANTGSGLIYNITNVNPNTPTTYYGKIFDTIGHNAYFTTGPVFSKLLYEGDDDVTSLDEWKIALNKDLTSFLADPQFLPGNELYITPPDVQLPAERSGYTGSCCYGRHRRGNARPILARYWRRRIRTASPGCRSDWNAQYGGLLFGLQSPLRHDQKLWRLVASKLHDPLGRQRP